MIMIYEAEIEQTVIGKLFIEADNLEQAKQVAERCVQEAQNLVDVDFDEWFEPTDSINWNLKWNDTVAVFCEGN